jgi:hypothetical protein
MASNKLGLVVVCFLLISGCQGGEVDPRPGSGDIYTDFDYSTDGTYSIEGTVELELFVDEDASFEGVTVCLFDQNGVELNRTNIGTLTSPDSEQKVHISSETEPRYIVVDHPGFHEYEALDTVSIRWRDGYVARQRDIDTFIYRPPSEPGECGHRG